MQNSKLMIKNDFENEELLYKYRITSYGTDFDIDGILRRVSVGDIYIPPFQRGFVWDINQSSKFVESLLLGLPVPGVFLAKEEDTEKLIIIDGQQRIYSLKFFYDGIFQPKGKIFSLTGLNSEFNNKTYKTLSPEDKRRLDNQIIHSTIVQQDEPDDGNSSIFLIFERLNTGGTLLQPQEIRSALYHGLFNDLLIELNANTAWRSLYGPRSKRKRDEELILRFFALFFALDKYERPLKIFLNRFMNRNKNLKIFNRESLTTLFFSTIDFIYQTFGKQAFRLIDTFNAALYDSLTVAISKNLERFRILDKKYLQKKFDDLKSDENFIRVITTATSDQENVITRIELACKYLK